MSRSRLPLVALVGAVGCTTQDAPATDGAPQAATSPLRKLKDRFFASEEPGKGGGIRALTPEERRSLMPRPIPIPEGMEAQAAAPARESPDGGTASDGGSAPDYAEQRRLQYEQRMQELREEAARRDAARDQDAGLERTPEQLAADMALATGPVPEDIAGQRRQQIARERVETEQFRKYGKGSGIQRRQIIQIIRGTDGGSPAPTPAPTRLKD
jgi:hypothetical protein